MRQYAGFGSAEATNQRFKFLLDAGQTGLSCAFDLPDPDGLRLRPPAGRGRGGQGRRGHRLAGRHAPPDGRPADGQGHDVHDDQRHRRHPAAALPTGGRGAGCAGRQDPRHHPERHPEGVRRPGHLHLPAAALHAPHRGHLRLLRRATSPTGTPSPSRATTSARRVRRRCRRSPSPWPTASPTSRRPSRPGMDVDAFAPRLSFFWNAHNNLFEEVAKYRAARRMWARIMTERFGAKDERSKMLRFHTQTGGIDPHRAAAGEQHRAGHRSRAWPPRWAGPRACTPTASTRRSACPRPGRPRSPCAPSRSWGSSRGWPTPSTRWPGRTSWRR